MNVSLGDIFGGLAFLLSIYATIKTIKFNERQKALIDAQEKLAHLQLNKERNELEHAKKGDVKASVVSFGNNKYKLRVFNQGKGVAKNVRIEFPDNNSPISMTDVNSKFPFESLVSYQSVDLIASADLGRVSKFTVRLTWDDDYKEGNESEVYLSY
ncbi:hypothetical protein GU944_001756 [Salmonella enterica]|nr:hypothetical protein [Salmonella enterica]